MYIIITSGKLYKIFHYSTTLPLSYTNITYNKLRLPELLNAEMLPKQNYQRSEVTLATGHLPPPSGERIVHHQAPRDSIPGVVFVLINDIRLLDEYVTLGKRLPSSEEEFRAGFRKESIKVYWGSCGMGVYNVGYIPATF